MTTSKAITDRIDSLKKQKAVLVSYLMTKVEAADWHGVSDAANDIREVESEIHGLEEGLKFYEGTHVR